jgi:hypothetical protein
VTKYMSAGPSGVPDSRAADVCAAGALVTSGREIAGMPRMVAAVSRSAFMFVLRRIEISFDTQFAIESGFE